MSRVRQLRQNCWELAERLFVARILGFALNVLAVAHTPWSHLGQAHECDSEWSLISALSVLATFTAYVASARPDLLVSCWVIQFCQRFHRIRRTDSDDHIMLTSSSIHLSLVGNLQPLFPQKWNYIVNSIRASKAHNWYLTHGWISPRRDLRDAIIYFSKCKTVSGPESSLCMSLGENGTCFFYMPFKVPISPTLHLWRVDTLCAQRMSLYNLRLAVM